MQFMQTVKKETAMCVQIGNVISINKIKTDKELIYDNVYQIFCQ